MNAHIRSRGLIAASANSASPMAVIAELNTAFAEFKARNNGKVDKLEKAVDDLNASVSALRVGGIGGDDSDGLPRNRRAAFNALGKFGRTGNVDALTDGLTVNASMSRDSGPDGGYVVGEEIATEILRIQRNDSTMRRIARVVMTSSASFKQPFSLNNAASGWVGERQSRPETDGPDLALIDVPAGEVYANPAITQNLLDDSAYDLGQFIATEIGDAFTAKEGSAFITGDGINKPRGFLTYDIVSTADDSRDFGKLQYLPSGVASALTDGTHNGADALQDLVFSLKAKYRQGASWLMNSATMAKVLKLKSKTEELYLVQRSLIEGAPDRLLGYPVEIDEDMPDVESNAYPIAFGDFSRGYLITDRQGVKILRDPYTNKPYVMFYATKRVGGGLLDSNAIKLLKIAAN